MSQFGSLAAIGTPLDQHLADLNARLGTDDVPYVRSPIKSFIVNRLYSHHQPFSVRAQVLSGCDAFLRTALATPGIFRQDAEASELQTLRSRVEAAYADRRRLELGSLTRNWHAAAGLLQFHLRELNPPLLGFELYPFFLAVGGSADNAMAKLGTLADLLGRLPASHLRARSRSSSPSHDTSAINAVMTAAELSKVFAPLLLRSPSGGAQQPRRSASARRRL